jgi:hypothetical protein
MEDVLVVIVTVIPVAVVVTEPQVTVQDIV